MPRLNEVKVQFCNMVEPQTDYIDQMKPNDNGYWGVTLGPLTPEQEEYLTGLGLGHLINNGKDYSPHVNMKQQVTHPTKGTQNKPPMYVDVDDVPVNVELGAGSVANLAFSVYEGKTGKQYILLQGVQVVELVESTYGEFTGFKEVV